MNVCGRIRSTGGQVCAWLVPGGSWFVPGLCMAI